MFRRPNRNATFRLGAYEVLGRIGAGGTATVYEARLERRGGFSRAVALKVFHPHLCQERDFVARLTDEVRFASRVRHPNVVATFDAGEDDGYRYLVLERIDGVTVRQMLTHRDGGHDPAIAARIVADAARGVHALHGLVDDRGQPLGVVHRDLSPHNLMVDREGRTVLIDLGLAKAAAEPGLTRTGVLCGKLPYMSPEQSRLEPLDARSDVFALGTILFELCTGELPFGDADSVSTMQHIRRCDRPTLARRLRDRGVPQWLSSVILACLHEKPHQRFADASALADALEQELNFAGLSAMEVRGRLSAEVSRVLEATGLRTVPAPLPPPIAARRPASEAWAALRYLAFGAAVATLGLGIHQFLLGHRAVVPSGLGGAAGSEAGAASLAADPELEPVQAIQTAPATVIAPSDVPVLDRPVAAQELSDADRRRGPRKTDEAGIAVEAPAAPGLGLKPNPYPPRDP